MTKLNAHFMLNELVTPFFTILLRFAQNSWVTRNYQSLQICFCVCSCEPNLQQLASTVTQRKDHIGCCVSQQQRLSITELLYAIMVCCLSSLTADWHYTPHIRRSILWQPLTIAWIKWPRNVALVLSRYSQVFIHQKILKSELWEANYENFWAIKRSHLWFVWSVKTNDQQQWFVWRFIHYLLTYDLNSGVQESETTLKIRDLKSNLNMEIKKIKKYEKRQNRSTFISGLILLHPIAYIKCVNVCALCLIKLY